MNSQFVLEYFITKTAILNTYTGEESLHGKKTSPYTMNAVEILQLYFLFKILMHLTITNIVKKILVLKSILLPHSGGLQHV